MAGPKLTINYTGITADDLNNVADDLGGLAKNISVAEGTNTGLTATANVAEGLLKGSVSADLDTAASGSTVKVDSVKQNKESSTMTSMRNIASVAIVSCTDAAPLPGLRTAGGQHAEPAVRRIA